MRARHVEHVQASHYHLESQAGVTTMELRSAQKQKLQSGFLHSRSSLENPKPAVKCASMRVTKLEKLVGKSSPFVGSKWASEMPAAKTKPQPVNRRSIIVGEMLANAMGLRDACSQDKTTA